ncbi:MAG TPA: plastocyanin/azurin family copper-binding protein, partial [Miltoncostaeaceae bacterium]|nr:plastocyanin/azurin family copper-binding protein [Miltoncostaeaceae bacterium]
MRRTALALTATAAVGVAGLVGVATAAKQSAAKPPVKRTLSASGTTLAFNKKALTAPRGRVQLVLKNRAPIRHNVAIRGNGLAAKKGKVVGQGGTSTVTATVRPGKYTYFCSVGGHEAAGMKGTLTVP